MQIDTPPDGQTTLSDSAPLQDSVLPTKQRTKRAVRFLISEGGDVVSERFRFEKSGTARSKAAEATESLLAGNQRFREVKF